jgi:hypothetical protein
VLRLSSRHACVDQDLENIRMEKIRLGMREMSESVLKGNSVASTKVRNWPNRQGKDPSSLSSSSSSQGILLWGYRRGEGVRL